MPRSNAPTPQTGPHTAVPAATAARVPAGYTASSAPAGYTAAPSPGYRPLSPNEQLYAYLIFGTLLTIGFFFGIVAGYQRPQVVVLNKNVAQAESAQDQFSPMSTRGLSTTSDTSPNSSSPQATDSTSTTADHKTTPPDTSATATPRSSTPGSNPSASPSVPSIQPNPGTSMQSNPAAATSSEPKPDKSPKPMATNTPPANMSPANPPPSKPPAATPPAGLVPVSFQKDVLPIFRTYCLNCHGGSGKPKGGVDLRTVASIMKGGGAPILVVGQPEKSAIYTTIEDMSMPPEGRRPTAQELAIIRNWILTGAKERRRRRGGVQRSPSGC